MYVALENETGSLYLPHSPYNKLHTHQNLELRVWTIGTVGGFQGARPLVWALRHCVIGQDT